MNYPNQDDYETEEEYSKALEWYWMEVYRQYDMGEDEQSEYENSIIPPYLSTKTIRKG